MELEEALGALISSGHDPEWLITNYSWGQLGLFSRCVLRSRLQMLNAVVGPVVEGQGADWKGHRVEDAAPPRKGKSKPKRGRSDSNTRTFRMSEAGDDEAKERGLLAAFASVGRGAKFSRGAS